MEKEEKNLSSLENAIPENLQTHPVQNPQMYQPNPQGQPMQNPQMYQQIPQGQPIQNPQMYQQNPQGQPMQNPQMYQQAPQGQPMQNPQMYQQAPQGQPMQNPQMYQQAPQGQPMQNPQMYQQNPQGQPMQNPQMYQQAPQGQPMQNPQMYQPNPQGQPMQNSHGNPFANKMQMPNFANMSGQMKNSFNMMKQNISDDEINKNLNNIPIKNEFVRKNALAICAALSIIFAFLPFIKFVVSSDVEGVADQSTTISGINALFGKNGTFVSAFMFLGPILLIIMNYIQQLKPYRRIISIAVPAVSLIFEIITLVQLKSVFLAAQKAAQSANSAIEEFTGESSSIDISSSLQIGFFLILISYVLTAVVGYITYYGLNNKKQPQNMQYNQQY